ncbi:MAG: hypothetical protein CMI60_03150 [Parvibaculum sp.]|nr:hypothetical protein [Parvibaculum sp.]
MDQPQVTLLFTIMLKLKMRKLPLPLVPRLHQLKPQQVQIQPQQVQIQLQLLHQVPVQALLKPQIVVTQRLHQQQLKQLLKQQEMPLSPHWIHLTIGIWELKILRQQSITMETR